ncbi:hypothetical protein [Rufibacter roseus]|uniref:Uncharacterized protein n=1 Tax=Rufibacter roseus TaxID=1567108 RepID=A0ABW2DN34_9BACT|nr:hypothetical protein [Rufibacter roseus]
MPTIRPIHLIAAVALLLVGCKTTKPLDPIHIMAVELSVDSLVRPCMAHVPMQKPTLIQRVFGTGSKTKLKNVTINVNSQTATGGSTIGANEQGGADNSKVKRSATSTAETTNTGGQGSKVDGDAEATASNKQGGGSLWWYVVAAGVGFAIRQFAPMLWRMAIPA